MTNCIRSGALQGFSDLAHDLSADPIELLEKAHIDQSVIQDEDKLISLDAICSLLEYTTEATGCSHVGLLLATRQKSDFLGLVGILMESSPNLEWVLKKAMRHFRIHAQGIDWSLDTSKENAIWSINFDLPETVPHQQSIELGIGQAFHLLRALSNNRWKPLRICFHHKKMENTWFYEQYFKVPIEYNAEFDGFLFKRGDLELPVSDSDERVFNALSQYAELISDDYEENLSTRVKALIRKLLPESQCNIEVIAGFLACDKRTLQRNLKKEGASYQGLLDEVRYKLAAEYLQNSSLTLAYIASMLGYDEFSSFSRAFKRHFGSSPSEWRKQKQLANNS